MREGGAITYILTLYIRMVISIAVRTVHLWIIHYTCSIILCIELDVGFVCDAKSWNLNLVLQRVVNRP